MKWCWQCVFCIALAFSGAEAISAAESQQAFAQQSSEVLSGLRRLGEQHGFMVAMEIENGNGKYILHIKQRHNETTERGLLRVDQKIIRIQDSIQGVLRDLRRENSLSSAPLPVFLEGDIEPVLNFAHIRDSIDMLKRKARHADDLFRLLREYYDETFIKNLESLKIPELAAINFLIAQAVKPSEKRLDFLCVEGISNADATPDELAMMAGAAIKLHALGEVILMPVEGKEEIRSALALVFKEGREFSNALRGAILQWTPPAEHDELLALLNHARSVHRYQLLLPRLEAYAAALERATLLKQFHERANRISEAVFIARERKSVERIAWYLGHSPEAVAPMVFGVDHNFTQAVTEWNHAARNRLGLVSFTHYTEAEDHGRGPSGFARAGLEPYCGK